jgi:hypothetical protein
VPRINVNQFLGVAPKIGDTLLKPAQATKAQNAKLWSHKLRPFGGLGLAAALAKTTGDIQKIYYFNGAWLAWTQDVDVVRGAIANDLLEKTYFTGTDKPRVTTNDIALAGLVGTFRPPDSYILGIPAPSAAPAAVDLGAGLINATSSWYMTFVRKYSDGTVEESAPSAPSNILVSANRQVTVTLPSGTMASPGDYGITHKRLYRKDGTSALFVTEQPFATASFIDNTSTALLGNALTTTSYLPPPDSMKGLIALPNGCTAGFSGNVVYISEPYAPHAYPLLNQYTVNYPIVAIGNVGTAIVVGTTAFPFIGRGIDPAQYVFKPSPSRLPCASKRSMVSTEAGAFYATTSGIADFDGAAVTLVTREFLGRDEWLAGFAPSTIHATYYDGRYMGWFSTGVDTNGTKVGGGFILDKGEAAFLVTLDDYVYASHPIPASDELWCAKRNYAAGNLNYVFKFEGDPATPQLYDWKSKTFVSAGRENFACAQVIADFGAGLTVAQIQAIQTAIAAAIAANNALADTSGPINGNSAGFEIDGGAMGGDNETTLAPSFSTVSGVVTFIYYADAVKRLQQSIYSSEPFPLPSGFTAERHQFELIGAVDVTQVTLATSFEELAEV